MEKIDEHSAGSQQPCRGVDITRSAEVSRAHYSGPRPHRRFSAADRRLILKGSIQIFARRLDENLPVTKSDLNRLVPYGDQVA
jgi:hypothetical protein